MKTIRSYELPAEQKPTQLKLKPEYREKLAYLAKKHRRSLANTVEILIEAEIDRDAILESDTEERVL